MNVLETVSFILQHGLHPGGWGEGIWLQSPPNRNLKKHILDVTILNILCDLHFSQNQPVKSADDLRLY
jgi:hypothetical protein